MIQDNHTEEPPRGRSATEKAAGGTDGSLFLMGNEPGRADGFKVGGRV